MDSFDGFRLRRTRQTNMPSAFLHQKSGQSVGPPDMVTGSTSTLFSCSVQWLRNFEDGLQTVFHSTHRFQVRTFAQVICGHTEVLPPFPLIRHCSNVSPDTSSLGQYAVSQISVAAQKSLCALPSPKHSPGHPPTLGIREWSPCSSATIVCRVK